MINLISKRNIACLLVLLLNTITCSLVAWEDCCDFPQCAWDNCDVPSCNRFYVGAFGGGIYSNSTNVTQMGTALFLEADGGPLAVQAEGSTDDTGSGFGGVQVGYEWLNCPFQLCSGWNITPAAELEAFWFSHTKQGHLSNRTDTDRLPEHDFLDTFPMDLGVYLANAVFSFNNGWKLSPYVGVGIGATRISISGADSLQVAPLEAGVNHFNSDTDDWSWAFAAQAKVGLRYQLCKSLHLFGEYRYLYVDFNNYVFGSTVYPDHAHTTPWNVRVNNIQYNAFAFGIQYSL